MTAVMNLVVELTPDPDPLDFIREYEAQVRRDWAMRNKIRKEQGLTESSINEDGSWAGLIKLGFHSSFVLTIKV